MAINRLVSGLAIVLCGFTSSHAEPAMPDAPTLYRGMCDASAAVPIGGGMFLAADDERNTLHVYRADRAGPPVAAIPWDTHLLIDPLRDRHPEADIEGATVLGSRIYWITSHGRNRQGKWRPNRHRLFAMTVKQTADGLVAVPFGTPSDRLVENLLRDRKLQGLRLAKAVGTVFEESKKLAPKKSGLNIEGLSARADGQSLLIAFRNPRPDGKALLVPLLNPAAVLAGGAAPKFGEPLQLKLETVHDGKRVALGIRSIEYSKRHGAYLIIAGPHNDRKVFAVYRWSGSKDEPPTLLPKATAAIRRIDSFTPEALIVYPDRDRVQVLSDDGSRRVKVASPAECLPGEFKAGQCEAKHLLDDRRKTFRSVWIDVE